MSSFILKFVAVDKLLHFLVSYGLTLTFSILTRNVFVSFVGVFLLGILKEVSDSRNPKNTFSVSDIVANTVGVVAGAIVALLI